jgi:hypothetical protein
MLDERPPDQEKRTHRRLFRPNVAVYGFLPFRGFSDEFAADTDSAHGKLRRKRQVLRFEMSSIAGLT